MKKLFRYLIGLGGKAPAPTQKRVVTAHELALKQAVARRRDEKSNDKSVDPAASKPELALAPAARQPQPAPEPVVARQSAETQSPPPGRRRKAPNKKRALAGPEAQVGKRGIKARPARAAEGPGARRGKRRIDHQLADVMVASAGARPAKLNMKKSQAVSAEAEARAGRKVRKDQLLDFVGITSGMGQAKRRVKKGAAEGRAGGGRKKRQRKRSVPPSTPLT